jgi:hypothetical protein
VAVCTVAALAVFPVMVADPLAAAAAVDDELELPEAEAMVTPAMVPARATAIAAIVMRGCLMVPLSVWRVDEDVASSCAAR